MKTTTLKRVRQLFGASYVSREQNRYNQRAWVRAIRNLGDRWLLAKQLERQQ
jgi:hypothetical protein